MSTPKKYQNFISAQNFPEDPKKIPESRILHPEKCDERTFHFAMKVPPGGGGKINYSYLEALLFV